MMSKEKPFIVIHKNKLIKLWAYEETDTGFIHYVPLWPEIGCNGPPAYLLKKAFWQRESTGDV